MKILRAARQWASINWWKYAMATFVLTCGIGIASIIHGLYFERPFLSYTNLPAPVLKPWVYPGEIIPLHIIRCSTSERSENYTTSRGLDEVGSPANVILAPYLVTVKPGCNDSVSKIHRVPEETPPGIYRVYGVAEVRGRIRMHYVEWYSEIFEVLEPK